MLVSHSWCEETANDILYEVEQLLCDNDIKINNKDPKQNKFEREDSYINIKDYNEKRLTLLKCQEEKITKQLIELVEYTEYQIEEAA